MRKLQINLTAGEAAYHEWCSALWADPAYRKIYAEEAAKSELWLQAFAYNPPKRMPKKKWRIKPSLR